MSANTFDFSEDLRMMRSDYFAKTLYTLSIQLSFTFGSVLLVSGNDPINQYFVEHFYNLSGAGFIGAIIVLYWMNTSIHPTSLQLGCFTVCQTIVICTIVPFFEHHILVATIGLSFAITSVMCIIACFLNRFDSLTEYMMLSTLATLLVGGIINLFSQSHFIQTFELYIGTILFMAYIVLDVQQTIDQCIAKNHTKNIHIHACLNIYLDILNLFVRLLQIYSLYFQKKNKNDGR